MRIIETDKLTLQNLPASETERLWIYNGLDGCVTHEIQLIIYSQLDEVTRRAYKFEMSMLGPILEMNMRGVLIDEDARGAAISSFSDDLGSLEYNLSRILFEGLGVRINWRSNANLLDLFYNILSLPVIKKRNAHGEFVPTVNRDALERLQEYLHAQPIINYILSLRDLGKRISFLQTGIDSDGRIRTSYNIGGTTTGRLSSSFSDFGTGTNLQNIELRLRKIFIADPGYKFCNIDLEQSDSRAVGAIIWNLFHSGKYLDVCESGDLHSGVSRDTWPDKNPRDTFYRHFSYRDGAKRLGHATNFMGSAPEISKQTKIPLPLVKSFQSLYLGKFPDIPQWWENRRQILKDTGVLTSLLGMRRYFFGRRDDNQTLKKMIAFEPQNTTAWTINEGLLAVWKLHKVQILLQVHDSILVQYPEETEDEIIPILLNCVQIERELKWGRKFIIPAEAKVGWNWAEAYELVNGERKLTNPDGLIKYVGHDARTRLNQPPTDIMGNGLYGIHRELAVARDL